MCCLDSEGTVTLKDVAKEAEVSVATVSRVINGSENVSMATRSRVLSAIETLNYAPNAHAIRLRGLRHASPLYAKKDGTERHENQGQNDLEVLRIQNKRLKRLVRTLIRDLARWRSLAEDSMESV